MRTKQQKERIEISDFKPEGKYIIYHLMLGGDVLYVGCTHNLISRLASHLAKKEFDAVEYREVDPDEAWWAENKDIWDIDPPLNGTRGRHPDWFPEPEFLSSASDLLPLSHCEIIRLADERGLSMERHGKKYINRNLLRVLLDEAGVADE